MKIHSVDKAIMILNCFSIEEPVLSVGAISRLTGNTPSTVSRLLSTMEKRGVVEKVEGRGRYQLGYRIYFWGLLSQAHNNLATVARPVMERLRDRCGEEVSLYIVTDNSRTCLERVASNHAIAKTGAIGGRLPLHAGASGKVLLAHLDEGKRHRILENEPLEKFTANTLTDKARLETELEQIRKQGYAVSKEEREPGAYSIVAPVRQAGRGVAASLCVAGPVYRLEEDRLETLIADVTSAADDISRKMGHKAVLRAAEGSKLISS